MRNFLYPKPTSLASMNEVVMIYFCGLKDVFLIIFLTRNVFSNVLTLTVPSVQITDGGLYYCQTEDKVGERHRENLQVYIKRMLENFLNL